MKKFIIILLLLVISGAGYVLTIPQNKGGIKGVLTNLKHEVRALMESVSKEKTEEFFTNKELDKMLSQMEFLYAEKSAKLSGEIFDGYRKCFSFAYEKELFEFIDKYVSNDVLAARLSEKFSEEFSEEDLDKINAFIITPEGKIWVENYSQKDKNRKHSLYERMDETQRDTARSFMRSPAGEHFHSALPKMKASVGDIVMDIVNDSYVELEQINGNYIDDEGRCRTSL